MDGQPIRDASEDGAGLYMALEGWAASHAALPPGALFFLEPGFVASAAAQAGLSPELAHALETAARRIAGDPGARALAWYVYDRLFDAPRYADSAVRSWPAPPAIPGGDGALLYVLALLGGLPALRVLYRDRRVPDEVGRDTLYDIQRWADQYRKRTGAWGISPLYLTWLRLHLRGELYALGRLQFQPGTWHFPAHAFRHRASGRVLAVSADGARYRTDGRRVWAADADSPEDCWTAHLDIEGDWIMGQRILPEGRVAREETRLPRAAWAPALTPGDPVLHLHIPEGERLDLAACRRSLEEALAFFPTHFPEWPFVAFACDSWLLDAQLDGLLPPSSNIVRFLRQLYLVPSMGDADDALQRVFDDVPTDLARAPRDTTLRRVIVDHLIAGGALHGAAGFLLPEDVPGWGTDVYRGT